MLTHTLAEQAIESDQLCRVAVDGSDQTINVKKNDLLLLSALQQGLDYPHNCRVGICGRCKTRVLKGRIRPMVDFALSPLSNEELGQGYVLACQAKVQTDLLVEVALGTNTLLPAVSVAGHISRWQRLPGEVIDLRLKLEAPLRFEAGQYASLAVSGSFIRRSFSFYDVPPGPAGTTEVGFLIKRLPGGRFSDWLYQQDRRGVRVWLDGPYGVISDNHGARNVLCIAGGTGIAPVLSILADRLRASATTQCTLVFGLRQASDRFAEAPLAQLQAAAGTRLRIIQVLSDEPADSTWRGARGLVTDVLNSALVPDFSTVDAFVCGSVPMVEAVERKLFALGMKPEQIHADKFLPAR